MKLNILKFDHFGRGIGKINEKIIFVNKALPEEIVDVEITSNKKNYYEGKIKEIFKESSSRIEAVCPYYDKCAGCNFLHTTYDEEKKFKKNKAKELLERCDNFYETSNLNYRNKVTLHVKDNKIGYYEEKSNKIIPIDYCYLVNDYINRVIKNLQSIDISNLDIKKIIIKANQDKILLKVDGKINNDFMNNFDYVDTIINDNKIVKGNGYLEEVIDNKIFKITSEAFFQVNKEGLENINKIIKKYLENKVINYALDLYSGTSLWGILISDYVKKVFCVELNKEACLNALVNIEKNNVSNVSVINGKVEDYIDQFNNIDLIIIDPPRSGLDKKTRKYLRKIKAKYFIYVSCDMQTLKRDLNDLCDIYEVEEINLVDMFKRTYHCEVVTILERKL